MTEQKAPSQPPVADQAGAAAALRVSADAETSADLLMAMLGEEGAAAALLQSADADSSGAANLDSYAKLDKKEIRARVSKLAAERPEMLARVITHWLKEERNKGR